jgi:hypothetical protein
VERTAIRLECLKLRYRPDRPTAEVIAEAKELENYVVESVSQTKDIPAEKRGPGRPRKEAGDSDILS